ncbi:Hypothetical predicted protein, partial [Marmota monax]
SAVPGTRRDPLPTLHYQSQNRKRKTRGMGKAKVTEELLELRGWPFMFRRKRTSVALFRGVGRRQ